MIDAICDWRGLITPAESLPDGALLLSVVLEGTKLVREDSSDFFALASAAVSASCAFACGYVGSGHAF